MVTTTTTNLHPIRVKVNGEDREAEVPARRTLVDLLRYDLGLTGTKEACSVGVCGACTVAAERQHRRLLHHAGRASRRRRHHDDRGHRRRRSTSTPCSRAFIHYGGFQCGICTPGQIVAAKALLDENPQPTEDEIKEWMMGNLCRCTGYYQIIDSMKKARPAGRSRGRSKMRDFYFHAPTSLHEALALLDEHEEDGRAYGRRHGARRDDEAIAGGRRPHDQPGRACPASPAIRIEADGLHIGALDAPPRRRELSRSRGSIAPFLAEVYSHVATVRIRNVGDGRRRPRARRPVAGPAAGLIALGAQVKLQSKNGERVVSLSTSSSRTTTRPASSRVSCSPR